MTESEPMIQCPKRCGNSLPLSQMHEHFETCAGKPINVLTNYDVIPIWPTSQSPIPQTPPTPPPVEVEKPKLIKQETIKPSFCKTCGTQYIENAFFRVCSKCMTIKAKTRFFWWLVVRYIVMSGWIFMAIGFILGITTYHAIYR